MATVYLGLGTNLGDRRGNLSQALRRLGEAGFEIEAISRVYASEPVGHREQPEFWNLVLRGRTELEPPALLERAKQIERELGRGPGFRNAPRPIDIDLLLYDDRRLRMAGLELPHPRMLERAFVLRPLVELDAELRHPGTGERFADHLARAAGLESAEPLFPGHDLLQENP